MRPRAHTARLGSARAQRAALCPTAPRALRLSQKITDKCFTRCVYKPSTRLDDSEKMCTAKCMDRYLDAMALVSQAWAARAKQQAQMPGGGGASPFQ